MNIEISSKGFFANLELPDTAPPCVVADVASRVADIIVHASHVMDIAPCDTAGHTDADYVNQNNGEQEPPY